MSPHSLGCTSFDQDRISRAISLAMALHRDQCRKGSSTPYVSHLLAVAALVMEDEGDEDQVIGALLHDAVEDQGGEPTLVMIRRDFGDRVADIVSACSDAAPAAGEGKAPWRQRKVAFLERLATTRADALIVVAADKLHNAEATLFDLRADGPEVWARFKTGMEGFLWYHTSALDALERRVPRSRSVARLQRVLVEIAELAP